MPHPKGRYYAVVAEMLAAQRRIKFKKFTRLLFGGPVPEHISLEARVIGCHRSPARFEGKASVR